MMQTSGEPKNQEWEAPKEKDNKNNGKLKTYLIVDEGGREQPLPTRKKKGWMWRAMNSGKGEYDHWWGV